MARATNWAKFTATASLGVIHKVRNQHSKGKSVKLNFEIVFQMEIFFCVSVNFCMILCNKHFCDVNFNFYLQGHEKEALNLMSTYLPKDSSPGSAYSEGGGLYALGEESKI